MKEIFAFYKIMLNGYTLAFTHTAVEASNYQRRIPSLQVEPFTAEMRPTNIPHASEIPENVWFCLQNALKGA